MLFVACKILCVDSERIKTSNKVVIEDTKKIADLKNDCEYVINNVVDLKGENIKLPANVLITFNKGGAVVNGTVTGNGTRIKSKYDNILGVNLKGTWCVNEINDLAFIKKYLTDQEIIENINVVQSDTVNNVISINRDYTAVIPKSGGYGLKLASNCKLFLNATLLIESNDFKSYSIILINKKKNVSIFGSNGGQIIGDVGKHLYLEGSTSEWGMGIEINESNNVTLEGLKISKCTGDGIYITGGSEMAICMYDHASKNIVVKNVVCDDNRRQGMSVIHVDGLEINNSSFINTGKTEFTGPGSGIDFEPNVDNGRNMSIRNVEINGCKLYGNKGKQQGGYNAFFDGNRCSFEAIKIHNTYYGGMCYIPGDMTFDHCEFESVTIRNSEMPVHVSFCNCTIANGGGVCVVIQKPIIQYKKYERNRDYSIVFDNCNISLSPVHYDERFNGLFYYKGNNNIYDGGMLLKECIIDLPKNLNPNMRMFCRAITGNVTVERSTINALERPLDLSGATYDECVINCEYIVLNTVREGKDVLKNCRVNTTSDKHILYVGDYGYTGDGYEIENCWFTNKKADAFFIDKKAKMKARPIVNGNRFFKDNTVVE